ncbi:MAG: hypothetical protein JNG88_01550 [Phycisphaerales bacterium]|nr:hypothetical protein [Phycisphaerales bacterium]
MSTERREELERLLSDWLDEPGRDELRARIDALVGSDAELIAVRRVWLRMRAAIQAPPRVNWTAQHERIMAALPTGLRSDEQLDERLAAGLRVTAEAAPIDWKKLQARVIDALEGAGSATSDAKGIEAIRTAAPRIVRFPVWRRTLAGIGVAAAAALAVWLAPRILLTTIGPADGEAETTSVVIVSVKTVAAPVGVADGGRAVAMIRVTAQSPTGHTPSLPEEAAIAAADEELFMIDPLAPAATPAASEEYGMF